MTSDMQSVYLSELASKYGEKDNEIYRAIRFRANIMIIKMMSEIMIMRSNYSFIGLKGLYNILGTNRTDFSKMYNGHIFEVRKKMRDAVGKNKIMRTVICGDVLLKIGEMDKVEKWINLFNQNDIPKEKIESIKQSVDSFLVNVKDHGENMIDPNENEYACCMWLVDQIKKYGQQQKNSIDRKVIDKAEGFRSLTFQELNECHFQTIEELYSDIKKVYNNLKRIYDYKSQLKEQNEVGK